MLCDKISRGVKLIMIESNTIISQKNLAILSSKGDFTSFHANDYFIRFKTSSHLEKYLSIKEYDNGYIVVMAKYDNNSEPEEEYIDLVPILENLYINTDNFLKTIKKVSIKYD